MRADSQDTTQQTSSFAEDAWVPTVCMGCYNCCGMLLRREGGKVVDVEGDPRSPNSQGHLCAKGKARFLDLHNPARIVTPLKRGNPQKGLGVDPQWQETTWDEALETITSRLQRVRREDPRKLVIAHFDMPGYGISKAFGTAFGTPNFHWNRADYCGAAAHSAHLLLNGSFNAEVDFDLCNYIVLWGTQLGHIVETIPLHAAHKLADARARGCKLVVIDPFCTNAAAKADEWIPIKPGTDGALALAMLNVMLNETGQVDVAFLKSCTNAPYLVGDDGHYLRDAASGKPLMWDPAAGRAVTFDSEGLGDPAIEGEFDTPGGRGRPAYQCLKTHVQQYDVESMARVTTVPPELIRRLTHEFCQAARIGGTIEVEGRRLPYRPAAIHFKRGSGAHKGGFHTTLAMHMINLMVGNLDVPGGQRGVNPVGPFWNVQKDPDGMLVPAQMITKYNRPYPPSEARVPMTLDLHELFPAALFTRGLYAWGISEPEKFGIDYAPEVLLHGRTNLMMNSHAPEAMAETLKKIPFQVSFTGFIDETAEFADIILPDAHDYERWDLFPANDPYAFITPGPGDWYWLMRQQALQAPEGVRPWADVYLELAERLGMHDELIELGNTMWGIDPAHRLQTGRRYSVKDIAERQAKTLIGENFTFECIRESACMITAPKTIEQAYPRPFFDARVPVYFEHLIKTGEQVRAVTDSLGLDWNTEPYTPLLTWFPCEALAPDGDYDLFIVNFKVPFHNFSISAENPWIDELSVGNPYTYHVMVGPHVAASKGLADGDRVVIESRHGRDEGTLKVTELVHPECIAIPGTFGHWARERRLSAGKSTAFNRLLPPPGLGRIDTLSGQIDTCVRVRIRKA